MVSATLRAWYRIVDRRTGMIVFDGLARHERDALNQMARDDSRFASFADRAGHYMLTVAELRSEYLIWRMSP